MSYARAMKTAKVERMAWGQAMAMQARAAAFPEQADHGVRAAILRGRARRISRALD